MDATQKRREPTAEDTALWLTRMGNDENDHEVAKLWYRGDAARGVFEHAARLPGVATGKELLVPGALLVTLMVDGGASLTEDAPLVVPPERSTWFVRTWLRLELDEIDRTTRQHFREP